MSSTLAPGLSGQACMRVCPEHTAEALGSGAVPVLGTPALVTLLEKAAVAALVGHLEVSITSVGVHLDVRHLAPTPIGMTVRATARLAEVEGRRLTFQVEAHDEVDKVAAGVHGRVMVRSAIFLANVAAKGKPSAG